MRLRRLRERQRAASYVFSMMISFAATVLVTRLFLQLTGYPQIGNSQLHIAHVLWGGLIVAVGATLPLIYSNQSIYGISAALSGVGLGLFFDEVGKFLTQNNNYFFRPAASIIYILFLLGLYVYIMVRRGEPDPQTRLLHVLELMQEIVDGDLDVHEKAELEQMLNRVVGDADLPDARELAADLLNFVQTQADTVPARPHPVRDWLAGAGNWIAANVLTLNVTRWVLILSTAGVAIVSLADLVTLLRSVGDPAQIALLVQGWIARAGLSTARESVWFALMIGIKGIVGLALIISLAYFAAGNDARGVDWALGGLLLSITTLNVLLFYFKQFLAAMYAVADFALIGGLSFFKDRYLKRGLAAQPEKAAE